MLDIPLRVSHPLETSLLRFFYLNLFLIFNWIIWGFSYISFWVLYNFNSGTFQTKWMIHWLLFLKNSAVVSLDLMFRINIERGAHLYDITFLKCYHFFVNKQPLCKETLQYVCYGFYVVLFYIFKRTIIKYMFCSPLSNLLPTNIWYAYFY